jgi:hypothetical protein
MQSFQDILENEGRTYSNCGLSRTSKPAVYGSATRRSLRTDDK